MDVNRPSQETPIPNFFLSGSYTFQDYIDSMEGATKSGMMTAELILKKTNDLQIYKNDIAAITTSVEANSNVSV